VSSLKFEISGKSTHSTSRSEARGMLRVDTERGLLPRLKIGVWRRRTYQEISDYTDHKMITLIESTYRFNQGVESSFSEFFTEWKISDLGDRGKSSMDTLWR